MHQKSNENSSVNLLYPAVIFAVTVTVLAWQLVFPGYYHIAYDDAVFGPKYVMQFSESLRQGVYYPRWMAENFQGYGSPTFVFYSPLLFTLSAVLNIASLGPVWSKTLLELLRLFVGALFLFMLVKKHLGEKTAIISAILYITLPTRILDIYFINTQAGRFAQVWMPVLLYLTDKYLEGRFSQRNLALISLSYAALIISHIATAYVFTPFIVLYGIITSNRKFGLRTAVRLLLPIGAGILLASIYFLPAALERCHVKLPMLEHLFPFDGNFIFNILHSAKDENQEGLLLMTKNTIMIELGLLALIVYLARRLPKLTINRHAKFALGAMLFCIFMMSSPSYVLWSYLPGLQTVALPFRFTAIYLIFYSIILGIYLGKIIDRSQRYRHLRHILVILLAAVILYEINLVTHAYRYTEYETERLYQVADMPEYLPKDARLEALEDPGMNGPLVSSEDDLNINIITWDYAYRVFIVSADDPVRLRVRTFYFPGWRAWVDGREAPVGIEGKTGALTVETPPGTHEVELRFTNTPVRTIGAWLSLFTLAALLLPYRRLRYLLTKSG